MLSEEDYVRLATRELGWLVSALDAVDHQDIEAELENDILTLEFSGSPSYVINSHRAARQIWMAAERQAWHFDFDRASERWRSDKGGEELWAVLSAVLEKKFGSFPGLRRPDSSG